MNKLFLTLSFCAYSISFLYAQQKSDVSGTYPFKFQDSISFQLLKYSLPFQAYPAYDPCKRSGIPPVTVTIPDTSCLLPFIPPSNIVKDPPGYKKAEGDVNIYWIHGLNGSVESLYIPAYCTMNGVKNNPAQFPPRHANCYWGNYNIQGASLYNEGFGITPAAQNVSEYFKKSGNVPTSRTEKDFIIAHSQGGIVAREWLRNIDEKDDSRYPDIAHGLVTFGTPHKGAMILNKTRPDLENRAPHFFNEACKALAGAEITPVIQNNFWTRLLISDKMKQLLIDQSCGIFSNTIIPFALDNYHKRTTLDYYVGSPFLNSGSRNTANEYNDNHPSGLSDYTLKVPVVQFYGEEEQPVMWRFFSSTLQLETDKMDNNQIQFGYDQDDYLQAKVNTMINDFYAKSLYETALEQTFTPLCNLALFKKMITLCRKNYVDPHRENKEAYELALRWLYNANDYYLAELVGAKESTTTKYCLITKGTRHLECTGGGKNGPRTCHVVWDNLTKTEYTSNNKPCPADIIKTLPGGYTYVETATPIYKTTYSYKANDGVVLAESAADPIKVSANNPTCTHAYWKMDRTNHDQMKNCQVTRNALTKLYNGELGSSFIVKVR